MCFQSVKYHSRVVWSPCSSSSLCRDHPKHHMHDASATRSHREWWAKPQALLLLTVCKKGACFSRKKKKALTVSKHHAFALTPWRPLSSSSHSSVECYHIERRLYRCAPQPTRGLKHRGMSLRTWANRTLGYAGPTHCSTVDVQGTLSTPLASPRGVPGHLQICWL